MPFWSSMNQIQARGDQYRSETQSKVLACEPGAASTERFTRFGTAAHLEGSFRSRQFRSLDAFIPSLFTHVQLERASGSFRGREDRRPQDRARRIRQMS